MPRSAHHASSGTQRGKRREQHATSCRCTNDLATSVVLSRSRDPTEVAIAWYVASALAAVSRRTRLLAQCSWPSWPQARRCGGKPHRVAESSCRAAALLILPIRLRPAAYHEAVILMALWAPALELHVGLAFCLPRRPPATRAHTPRSKAECHEQVCSKSVLQLLPSGPPEAKSCCGRAFCLPRRPSAKRTNQPRAGRTNLEQLRTKSLFQWLPAGPSKTDLARMGCILLCTCACFHASRRPAVVVTRRIRRRCKNQHIHAHGRILMKPSDFQNPDFGRLVRSRKFWCAKLQQMGLFLWPFHSAPRCGALREARSWGCCR